MVVAGDAAAAGRYALESALVERLNIHEQCARPRNLLRLDQLLATAELACGNVILHLMTTMGMMVQGLEAQVTSAIMQTFMICASIFPNPRVQKALTGVGGDQGSIRSHHRIDHIASAQRKLLDPPINTGADDGLFEFALRPRPLISGTIGTGCIAVVIALAPPRSWRSHWLSRP